MDVGRNINYPKMVSIFEPPSALSIYRVSRLLAAVEKTGAKHTHNLHFDNRLKRYKASWICIHLSGQKANAVIVGSSYYFIIYYMPK